MRNSPLVPFAAAVALVGLAYLIRLPLESVLHGSAPYALFYLAVLASAWFYGVRSAVLASVLSALAAEKLVIGAHEPHAFVSLIPFAMACAGMVLMARGAREMRSREERANAYLASIVQSTDDAVISKDLNGIITSCNPGCERIYGYTAAELVGRPVTVLFPSDRYQEEADVLARLRRGERIEHMETVRRTKDGRLIDVSLTISPVRNAEGAIIGVSKVARDVTEIRRAQRELAAHLEWFRVTLGSIGDAVIASDPEGKITFLNATATRLTGWEEESARGRPLGEVFQIYNEKTREPVEDPANKVLRTGHVLGLANHTVLRRRDGSEIPIADSAAPIRDAAGSVIGVVLVFHDVSEQRRTQDALAEQREWFERTLESIGDAVIATDVQCNVVFMNPIAEHLTGWNEEDARGRNCEDVFRIVNETTRATVDNPVRRVLDEGAIVGLANHTVLIARDGTERPIDDSGSPIRNPDGRIVGVVLVFRDVSERQALDQERETYGRERERLLEAERFARSEAERANRAKDDFMAMVSHELRTPLTAILGWTEMLLKTQKDPETLHGLEVIGRNTRIQAQLISDLLDISRIVSGKLLLEVQSVDLSSIVEAAIDTVRLAADAKRISIRRKLDTAVGPMIGDPARLQQVLWNLLSNSIRFTPKDGVVVVEMHRVESRVEIAVKDNGVGIRPEVIDRIFDRFHQHDSPTTRRHGGLGLGLSIVRHLVELHGGAVRAESAGEGQGATFTISLPLSLSRAPQELRSEVGPPSFPLPTADGSLAGVRILVVDDERDTRDLIQRLVEAHGAKVRSASDAEGALELIRGDRPDILVSDIGLPSVDGYELIRRIRGLDVPGIENMPAVALTAFARSEDRTRALLAGYQVHIAKPVEPGELIATLASFANLLRLKPDSR